MNLTEKINAYQKHLTELEADKKRIHEEMKEVREKIRKYERVLKEAEEIESVEEKPLV